VSIYDYINLVAEENWRRGKGRGLERIDNNKRKLSS